MLRRVAVSLSAAVVMVGGLALPASAAPVGCWTFPETFTTVTLCVESDSAVRQVYVKATSVVPAITLTVNSAELWRYRAGVWTLVVDETPGSFSGLGTIDYYGEIWVASSGEQYQTCADVDVTYGTFTDHYHYICGNLA